MKLHEIFEASVKPTVGKLYYHGTKARFDHFDIQYLENKESRHEDGPGFYFTDNINVARGYAAPDGVILQCRLTPRIIIKPIGRTRASAASFMMRRAPNFKETLMNWDEDPLKAERLAMATIFQRSNPKETFEQIWADFYMGHEVDFAKKMIRLGYDAFLGTKAERGDTHIIMLNPEKIRIVQRIDPNSLGSESNEIM